MKNKRVIAKIVDTVIFIFFTMCTSTMFLFLGLSIMEIFGAELQALNTFIGMEPLEIVELIMDDTILYIQIMFFANLFLMLSAFVYFVIISSKLHGSPGKYLFHMSIAKKEDATSNFKLFLREPLVHMIIWTMVLNLIFI
ncbi:MAG: RDD family protein, partial [Spiroplasma sp.]|nr:RDD family protein [Mycoplasmatales bacterium]